MSSELMEIFSATLTVTNQISDFLPPRQGLVLRKNEYPKQDSMASEHQINREKRGKSSTQEGNQVLRKLHQFNALRPTAPHRFAASCTIDESAEDEIGVFSLCFVENRKRMERMGEDKNNVVWWNGWRVISPWTMGPLAGRF